MKFLFNRLIEFQEIILLHYPIILHLTKLSEKILKLI